MQYTTRAGILFSLYLLNTLMNGDYEHNTTLFILCYKIFYCHFALESKTLKICTYHRYLGKIIISI